MKKIWTDFKRTFQELMIKKFLRTRTIEEVPVFVGNEENPWDVIIFRIVLLATTIILGVLGLA